MEKICIVLLLILCWTIWTETDFPLIQAASDGDIEEIKRLIAQKNNVNQTDKYGFTALMKAAWRGNITIVDLLIHAGADINAPDNNGMTPLHLNNIQDMTFKSGRYI